MKSHLPARAAQRPAMLPTGPSAGLGQPVSPPVGATTEPPWEQSRGAFNDAFAKLGAKAGDPPNWVSALVPVADAYHSHASECIAHGLRIAADVVQKRAALESTLEANLRSEAFRQQLSNSHMKTLNRSCEKLQFQGCCDAIAPQLKLQNEMLNPGAGFDEVPPAFLVMQQLVKRR
jgi:hypothetical protein